ncbi:MAG: hypothetical protein HKL95_08865, partial [Phycisphaerae bacterium]|nr:hypothetical protein [Phycisphaerae bacterium]
MFKVVAIVSVVAALLSPNLTRAQPAMPATRGVPVPAATTLTAKRVSLTITLLRKVIYPGSPVLVSAVFRNNGKRKFEVSGWPVRFTFKVISAESLKTGKSAAPTRCMIHTPQAWSFHIFTRLVVLAGRAKTFWKQIDFARYYDLTMPGKYRLLVQAGRLKSNAVIVTVVPFPTPHTQQPAVVATRGQAPIVERATSDRDPQVSLRRLPWKAGSPMQATVYLRCRGKHRVSV